jgi:seryl-tRNA(Sec) selenium transferase
MDVYVGINHYTVLKLKRTWKVPNVLISFTNKTLKHFDTETSKRKKIHTLHSPESEMKFLLCF